jgi:Cu+-exporting ATPase
MASSQSDPRRPQTAVTLHLSGLHCTNCALSIEKHLHKLGVTQPCVDYASSSASFQVSSPEAVSEIIQSIQKLGYSAHLDKQLQETVDRETSIIRKLLISGILTLPLLIGMFIESATLHNPWIQWVIASPVFYIGLRHFGESGIRSLRAGVANMDVLIALGILGGYLASVITLIFGLSHETIFFEATCSITTFVMLGHLLEERAVKRTTTAIESLGRIQPTKACRIDGVSGNLTHIDTKDIVVGDILYIRDGESIPTDGIIIEGALSCNESMLTGESSPVEHGKGDAIIGGTVVIHGSARMQATAVGADTTLSGIIQLVHESLRRKPQIQRIGDAVSSVFVPAVLLISIGVLSISLLFFDLSAADAIVRALAITVVACPCAMGLATPTAIMVALGKAAQSGILIRGGDTLERMATITCIAFDKTGTLTDGRFSIEDFATHTAIPASEAQEIIAALATTSSHPIAQSLCHEFKESRSSLTLSETEELKGVGITGRGQDGSLYAIGGRQLIRQNNIESGADLVLLKDGALLASMNIVDSLRSEAKSTINSIRDSGYKTTIISGDSHKKTSHIAAELTVDSFYAEQLPQDKLTVLDALQKSDSVAFVGDGINDAPTLGQATIGISLSSGSDVARHSAQVILSDNSLTRLSSALKLSRITVRTIKQNLGWAFLYNIIAIPLAASGYITPLAGALLMTFSDVIIVANSLRIKLYKL